MAARPRAARRPGGAPPAGRPLRTTASTIWGLGVVMLLEHPDQLAAFRDDPAPAAGAVEEMVRLQSIGDAGAARPVVADIEVGGRPHPGRRGHPPADPGRQPRPRGDRPARCVRHPPRRPASPRLRVRHPPVPGGEPGAGYAEIALRTLFECHPHPEAGWRPGGVALQIRGGDIRPALAPGRVVGPVGPAWRVGGSRRRWIHAVDALTIRA